MWTFYKTLILVYEFNISSEIKELVDNIVSDSYNECRPVSHSDLSELEIDLHPRSGDVLMQLDDAYIRIHKKAKDRKIWVQPDEEGFCLSVWFGELNEVLEKIPHMQFLKLSVDS